MNIYSLAETCGEEETGTGKQETSGDFDDNDYGGVTVVLFANK